MKSKLQLFILSNLLIFSLAACQRQNNDAAESKKENINMKHLADYSNTGKVNNTKSINEDITEEISGGTNERTDEIQQEQFMNIKIGQDTFWVVLYDNDSTRALREKLPMTIQMDEMNGNEKYYFMNENIPSASESVERIEAGDFMLFGSDCLVLFYEDFQTSYTYTRLGYVENVSEFVSSLGSGSVEVTFSIEK